MSVSEDFPQPKFDVQEEDVDERTRIIDAGGEIHVSTAPRFSVLLDSAIGRGKTAVVLDLSEVEFIDSTGLGGLLELRSTLRARNVVLEIVAGDGPVRQAVEITGLAELLAPAG